MGSAVGTLHQGELTRIQKGVTTALQDRKKKFKRKGSCYYSGKSSRTRMTRTLDREKQERNDGHCRSRIPGSVETGGKGASTEPLCGRNVGKYCNVPQAEGRTKTTKDVQSARLHAKSVGRRRTTRTEGRRRVRHWEEPCAVLQMREYAGQGT